MDQRCLSMFGLTKREYNDETNKYLYHSISLSPGTSQFRARCHAVLRIPSRARNVHRLYMQVDEPGDIRTNQTIAITHDLLHSLPNIVVLRIIVFHSVSANIILAAATNLPARLRLFSTNAWDYLTDKTSIYEFFRSQSTIVAIEDQSLHAGTQDSLISFTPDILPSLEYIYFMSYKVATRLALGRPVHTLGIFPSVSPNHIDDICRVAATSKVPIRTIRLASSDANTILHSLSSHLPHLRSLGILSEDRESPVAFYDALAIYPELEEVQWWHNDPTASLDSEWNVTFASAIFRRCERMRRIVVATGRRDDAVTQTFVRKCDASGEVLPPKDNNVSWITWKGRRTWNKYRGAGHRPLEETWGIITEDY